MKVNYALTDEEVDKGFILSCVSVPTSKKLVVSYDG
jgi:ring-1,2-phenylacetyl-CoA epoxidase subunit PaaE